MGGGTGQFVSLALAIIMLSLGLSLTLADFRRVLQFPRAVFIALVCQTIALPLVCFAVVRFFALPPELAVGVMLVAASPGGTMANLFSHLADGDLALNITLTAINSVLSIVTLPLILILSLQHFLGEDRAISLQFAKVVQVLMFVIVPVAIGMALRGWMPQFAARMNRPVKILAALFLIVAAILAISASWDSMVRYFPQVGAAVIVFNLFSLAVGYGVPRLARIPMRQAVAISLEIGMHNGALAIAIAMSPLLLNNPLMAVPPTLYSVLALFSAAAFVMLVTRAQRHR